MIWRRLFPRPTGALPSNLVTRFGVALIAVLVAALILAQLLRDAPDSTVGPDQTLQPTNRAGQQQLESQMAAETRRQQQLQQQERLRRRAEATLQQPPTQQSAWSSLFSTPQPAAPEPVADYDLAGALSDDELKLRETLRLEEIERRTRSLRSLPVAHSYRSQQPGPAPAPSRPSPEPSAPVIPPAPSPDPSTAHLEQSAAELRTLRDQLQALATAQQGVDLPLTAPTAEAVPPTPAEPQPDYADPERLAEPADPPGWERIYEGSFLEAILLTQLSGDFPGPVLAQVAVRFYSRDRQRVLVPRGAQAIGTAREVNDPHQARLAVSFHRLLLPDGRWIALPFHGLNQVGESALKDKVNRHYVSMFAAAGAVGILSGLTLQGSNPYAGGLQGFRAGGGQGIGLAATHILQRFLNRLPTITIRTGHRLRIWFTSDVLVPRPGPTSVSQKGDLSP